MPWSTRRCHFRIPPMGELTTIMARDGHEFQAWLAAPAGRPRGAVVVIQEIFGVNGHIRAVTDGFAAAGYTAIAPSLFDRIRRGIELQYSPADMQAGSGYRRPIPPETAPPGDRPQGHRGRCGRGEALGPHRRRRLLLGREPRLFRRVRAAARGRGGLLRPGRRLAREEAPLSGALPLRKRR